MESDWRANIEYHNLTTMDGIFKPEHVTYAIGHLMRMINDANFKSHLPNEAPRDAKYIILANLIKFADLATVSNFIAHSYFGTWCAETQNINAVNLIANKKHRSSLVAFLKRHRAIALSYIINWSKEDVAFINDADIPKSETFTWAFKIIISNSGELNRLFRENAELRAIPLDRGGPLYEEALNSFRSVANLFKKQE